MQLGSRSEGVVSARTPGVSCRVVGLGASTSKPTIPAAQVEGPPEGQVRLLLQQEGKGTGRKRPCRLCR